MARAFTALIVAVGLALVAITHAQDLGALWRALLGIDGAWLSAAVIAEFIAYALLALGMKAAFDAVRVSRPFRRTVPLTLASVYVEGASRTGTQASQEMVVEQSAREGFAAQAASRGVAAQRAIDLAGLAAVLAVATVVAVINSPAGGPGAGVVLGISTLMLAALAAGIATPVLTVAGGRTAQASALAYQTLGLDPPATGSEARDRLGEGAVLGSFVAHVLARGFELVAFASVALAFHVTSLPVALAGYGVIACLRVVPMVPGGLVVAPAAAALVMWGVGATLPVAILVALLYRVLSYWIPFALGALPVRRSPSADGSRWTLRPSDIVTARIAGSIVLVLGLINMVTAIVPGAAAATREAFSGLPLLVSFGTSASAFAGVALVYVSYGLYRRKRVAWWIVVIATVAVGVAHALSAVDFEEVFWTALLVAWLVAKRSVFHGRSDAPSLRSGLRALLAAFVVTLAYGTLGFYLLDTHYGQPFTLPQAILQTVSMFFLFRDPGLQPVTAHGVLFARSIYVVAGGTLAFALVQLLRPVVLRGQSSSAEVDRAKSIAEQYGSGPLARIAVLPDKHFFFTEGGSVVCFATRAGVAVALGDPIGPEDDAAAAIAAYTESRQRNGRTPAFYQTPERYLPLYEAAGYDYFSIGQEAVVDLTDFSMSSMRRSLRSAVKKLAKQGYTSRVVEAPIPDPMIAQLKDISDEWLTAMHGTEKRFSLGWFEDDYVRQAPVFIVEDPDGEIQAFANILPEYNLNQSTVDMIRHRETSPPGVMDFMFVRLFEWAAEQGYDSFSLGLSALSGIGDDREDPLPEKLMRLVYEHGSRFYSFKGLHSYKDKFHPRWEPRYLVYRPEENPLTAVAAAGAANSDENMIIEYGRELLGRG